MFAPLGANRAIGRIRSIVCLGMERLENLRQENLPAIIGSIIDPTSSSADNASSEPNIALSSTEVAESADSHPRSRAFTAIVVVNGRRIGELVYIDAIDCRRKGNSCRIQLRPIQIGRRVRLPGGAHLI